MSSTNVDEVNAISSVMAYAHDAMEWMTENKLKTVGGLWATGVTGSLAYQWSKPIPVSLKLIHSRVYAQAITLGALGVTALVSSMVEGSDKKHE